MKVIVFGGNGFLGSQLVNHMLQQKYSVLVCDLDASPVNLEAPYMTVDVREKDKVAAIPFEENDIVIILAANQYHHKVPKKNRSEFFFNTNTNGTKNILEGALNKGCRNVIFFSTDMVYGKPNYLPVDAKHPRNPFGPYGQSKKAAEDICFQFREKNMNITIFRPRMIIGPGRLGILKKLFSLIQYGLPVPTIGNGKNCYQMISVFDCVTAIMLAIEKGFPNKEFNLGSKNPPQTRALLQNLVARIGSKTFIIPTYGPMVKGVLKLMGSMGLEIMYREQYMIADENYVLDISETEEDLGWSPQFSDQDMILQAYETWHRNGLEKAEPDDKEDIK